MKFMLQIIADASLFGNASAEGAMALDKRVNVFNRELRQAGAWVAAEGPKAPKPPSRCVLW